MTRAGGPDDRALALFREQSRAAFMPESDQDNDGGPVLGVHDYWSMVRDRLWLVLALAFLVTLFAIFYVARQPNIYEAESSIQVDIESNPAIGSSKEKAVIINQGDDPAYFNTQLQLLKSPAFLRRVVKTLDLEHDSRFFAERSAHIPLTVRNLARLFGSSGKEAEPSHKPLRSEDIAPASADGNLAEAQRLQPYVEAIRLNLDVKITETTRLISIRFSHTDAATAARVVNVIADTFVQANWERRGATNSSASDFLQKRIAELQFKIGENERRIIDYAKQHQVMPPNAAHDIEGDRLAGLDKGLLEAENARKLADAEYQAALAPGAAAALVEGGGNPQLAILNARLNELRQRREVMLLEAGENWPEVKELKKQITNLEQELKDTREHAIAIVLTNLETRFRQALAREQALRKSFNEQHSETLAQDEAAINYRMIQQETTTYKGLLDNLLQRSKENDVVLAATPNNVHVTDYATLPVRLLGPMRLRIVAMALGGSMALGIGLAVLLGMIDDHLPVDSIERAERLFNLPALAVLPTVKSGGRVSRSLPRWAKRSGHTTNKLLIDQELRSPLAESYKKLRTSVFLSANGSAPRSVLVVSSHPAEGKTTAVINTGLAMSQTGAKVLLIDADLRHPSLHEVLEVENEKGLSTILSGDLSAAEAHAMVGQYANSSLYFLASGPLPDNPAELLGSKRMRSLLEDFGGTFSHIIIDSPPISYFTDAVVLSMMVDSVLLMVRGPKSSVQVARHSLQSLESVNAPLLGVVLNDVNMRSNDYSYYRGYYQPKGSLTSGI